MIRGTPKRRNACSIAAEFTSRIASGLRDVAARLSISPETLSRALRQLADRGILAVQGYRIGLLDPVALLALARCGRAA